MGKLSHTCWLMLVRGSKAESPGASRGGTTFSSSAMLGTDLLELATPHRHQSGDTPCVAGNNLISAKGERSSSSKRGV